MTHASEPAPDMLWSGWGDPAEAVVLPEETVALLEQFLGVKPAQRRPVALDGVRLDAPALTMGAKEAIVKIVGAEHVRTDHETRVRHTRGKSTPDLLKIRAGEAVDAPDAVVLPGDHDEVEAVLHACSNHRVAVVPFGGGTSVVGGLVPVRGDFNGVVALDLRRLNRLVALDPVSQTATLEAGLRTPQAEALLASQGYQLGHAPQSYEYASIGGYAATRSSGQASAGYGRFDALVVALTLATPKGTWELGRSPASAAGPDLRQLVLGSEGAFGVITSVTVRIRPLPQEKVYDGWRFADFATGAAALRELVQTDSAPTVLRLSDETETMIGLARPGEIGQSQTAQQPGGVLVIAGYEGTAESVARRRELAGSVLRAHGGELLDPSVGEGWALGRFRGPYLRDALLDLGALAETLETATFWSKLPALYDAVRTALTEALTRQGTPPLVLCHISHVYPTGASLYFTAASAQTDDPLAQWLAAKTAACDAILAAGGTITHHHAVGTDHQPWYLEEIGPFGAELLRAVKDRLDPEGVCNPGILIPR